MDGKRFVWKKILHRYGKRRPSHAVPYERWKDYLIRRIQENNKHLQGKS